MGGIVNLIFMKTQMFAALRANTDIKDYYKRRIKELEKEVKELNEILKGDSIECDERKRQN